MDDLNFIQQNLRSALKKSSVIDEETICHESNKIVEENNGVLQVLEKSNLYSLANAEEIIKNISIEKKLLQKLTKEFEFSTEGLDLRELLHLIESYFLMQALEKTSNNKQRAAQLLKMNRTTLLEKLKRMRQC